MLQIEDLTIKTTEEFPKTILHNFNLKVKSGIIGITGQNGSGKSTLAKVLVGIESEKLEICGKIEWENLNLLNLNIVQKAEIGIFLAFQNPPIIKGISTLNLLKAVLETKFAREDLEQKVKIDKFNELQNHLEELQTQDQIQDQLENKLQKKLENKSENNLIKTLNNKLENQNKTLNNGEIDNPPNKINLETNLQKKMQRKTGKLEQKTQTSTFNSPKIVANYTKKILNIIKENAVKLEIGNLYRQKMENLSGGERKKMEILQLLCLEPNLVILDEVDSGLDELSQVLIAKILRDFANIQRNRNLPILIIISHNSHFLNLLGCDKIIKIEKIGN